MSIDAEEAAIRIVILGALMGHSEAGERGFATVARRRRSSTDAGKRIAAPADARYRHEAGMMGKG